MFFCCFSKGLNSTHHYNETNNYSSSCSVGCCTATEEKHAAAASVRVIPAMAVLLWQQARSWARKRERFCTFLKIFHKALHSGKYTTDQTLLLLAVVVARGVFSRSSIRGGSLFKLAPESREAGCREAFGSTAFALAAWRSFVSWGRMDPKIVIPTWVSSSVLEHFGSGGVQR